MKKYLWFLLAPSFMTTAVVGCLIVPTEKSYPPFDTATRIEVKYPRSETLRVIDNPVQIQKIVEFVDSHPHGWGIDDLFGIPIPLLTINFYEGAVFKGNFGVGPGYFVTHRAGDFASLSVSSWQEKRFLELIGEGDFDLRAKK
jgi:hypothetical protein